MEKNKSSPAVLDATPHLEKLRGLKVIKAIKLMRKASLKKREDSNNLEESSSAAAAAAAVNIPDAVTTEIVPLKLTAYNDILKESAINHKVNQKYSKIKNRGKQLGNNINNTYKEKYIFPNKLQLNNFKRS